MDEQNAPDAANAVDVAASDRLALLGEASNDVVHAIAEHKKTSCPPEVQGYC